MKIINKILTVTALSSVLAISACQDKLDEPAENKAFTQQTDYTIRPT